MPELAARRSSIGVGGQQPNVLVVEPRANVARRYANALDRAGYNSVVAANSTEADAFLRGGSERFACSFINAAMPDIDIPALVTAVHDIDPQHVVIVGGHADPTLLSAVQSESRCIFIRDAVTRKSLLQAVSAAVARQPAAPGREPPGRVNGFIGASPQMLRVYREIEAVAKSDVPVFISGESGTGKEICAQAIHEQGLRKSKPFVGINCAAIPAELLESQLFGHVRGSFSGAHSDHIGLIRAADGGTLFLDEICEMDIRLQAKLLRFLQTQSVWPVGATHASDVDVRIICATNRNALQEVAAGRLREDLYFRLCVVPIELPPLRERGDDCLLLADAFLQQFARQEGKRFARLGAEFGLLASAYSWPGNVRELQNVMRRAVVMCDGPQLPLGSFIPAQAPAQPLQKLSGMTLEQVERLVIESAVLRHEGALSAAARQLSISPSTLYRKRERWATPPVGKARDVTSGGSFS